MYSIRHTHAHTHTILSNFYVVSYDPSIHPSFHSYQAHPTDHPPEISDDVRRCWKALMVSLRRAAWIRSLSILPVAPRRPREAPGVLCQATKMHRSCLYAIAAKGNFAEYASSVDSIQQLIHIGKCWKLLQGVPWEAPHFFKFAFARYESLSTIINNSQPLLTQKKTHDQSYKPLATMIFPPEMVMISWG